MSCVTNGTFGTDSRGGDAVGFGACVIYSTCMCCHLVVILHRWPWLTVPGRDHEHVSHLVAAPPPHARIHVTPTLSLSFFLFLFFFLLLLLLSPLSFSRASTIVQLILARPPCVCRIGSATLIHVTPTLSLSLLLLRCGRGEVQSVSFSSDGRFLAMGMTTSTLEIVSSAC